MVTHSIALMTILHILHQIWRLRGPGSGFPSSNPVISELPKRYAPSGVVHHVPGKQFPQGHNEEMFSILSLSATYP